MSVEANLDDRRAVACVPRLCITFVFLQWCAFEAASCPRHQTLNEDKNLNLTRHPSHVLYTLCVPSMARLNFRREFSLIIQGVQVSDVQSIDAHSKLQGCLERSKN